jgi:hypothetical protein
MDALIGLYGMFIKDKGKGKERFDIILEPMQAMTQIALISFCPKGSKLSITNNLIPLSIGDIVKITYSVLPTLKFLPNLGVIR